MLRILLSVFALSALLSSVVLTTLAARGRCPVKDPETLLSLYRSSDAIFLTHFDHTEYGEVKTRGEHYQYVTIKKYFTVSTTLKGESQPGYILEDEEYRPAMTEEPEAVDESESEPAEAVAGEDNETAAVNA